MPFAPYFAPLCTPINPINPVLWSLRESGIALDSACVARRFVGAGRRDAQSNLLPGGQVQPNTRMTILKARQKSDFNAKRIVLTLPHA